MTDYHSLPCPVKYEELQREALSMHLLLSWQHASCVVRLQAAI